MGVIALAPVNADKTHQSARKKFKFFLKIAS
jgi:hypothetical protein